MVNLLVTGIEPSEFTDKVFEKLGEYYSELATENTEEEDAGFFDRTLECWSFNFTPQSSGDGQIACVSNLYLSKNYGPAHANTAFFCGHFTLPATRYTGQVIPPGQAADCAAWAANAAAVAAGYAFARNINITDEALIRIFITSFNVKMTQTNCGYGTMTKCENAICLEPPTPASWNVGFFDWLDEQLFGCE